MSHISLTYPHRFSAAEVKEKMDALLHSLQQRADYFEHVEIRWSADQRDCSFRGEGFSGRFHLCDGAVEVDAELEGMLAMFRPVVEQKLREYLERYLGPEA